MKWHSEPFTHDRLETIKSYGYLDGLPEGWRAGHYGWIEMGDAAITVRDGVVSVSTVYLEGGVEGMGVDVDTEFPVSIIPIAERLYRLVSAAKGSEVRP